MVDVEADATRQADTDAQSKRTEPNDTDAQSKRTEPCGKGHSWWHSVLVHINDTDCCAACEVDEPDHSGHRGATLQA